ncbi:MAG TPA: PepSY-associated TM helix domain-containing protein [Rhizomicrobium sp.]|nr:PepSY-associated TM helix domain-containing protein [Rhizomicrobium sp.]
MSFTAIRHSLFTVHMWIGLVLGILLAALGLSGSLLVYDDTISDWISPPPHATTAGQPLPLSMIAGIARDSAAEQGLAVGTMQIVVPLKPSDAVVVRFNGISRMGTEPAPSGPQGDRGGRQRARGFQMYIDPVSGEVLGNRPFVQPGLLTFAHQLHGNFLMGREGRRFVGWLGAAMCLLGASGLVLWWPKRGQWKYAFKVRRSATGLRFHRELHAATGIWIFLVFMAVSVSGVVIAWPQTLGMNTAGPREMPMVEPQQGKMLGATEAVIAATKAVPDLKLRSVTIPRRPEQPIMVNYLSNGAINAVLVIDPYSGKVLAKRDNSERFLAWMRPVHDGSLGAVWSFLVFLSGLVPSLFVVTGVIMWWKKRQRRVPMTAMTEDITEGEVVA